MSSLNYLDPTHYSPFERGQWIQDPRFDNLPVLDTFHEWKDRDASVQRNFEAHKPGLSNVHMLLRNSFFLPENPESAQIKITADDRYKLWVNGTFAGEGPAPGYPWQYYYNSWDLLSFVKEGENVLAVQVYYQGMITRVWNSLDHRMGMVAECDMVLADGSSIQIDSDDSWRYRIIGSPTTVTHTDHKRRRSPEAYYLPSHSGGMIGSLTQFQENIDSREIKSDWRKEAFEDSSWKTPSTRPFSETDYQVLPQPTPPLEYGIVKPVRIEKRGEDRYFIDFGRQVTGSIEFTQPGADGHVIEIRHAEELTPGGEIVCPMRCNCDYREFWTLSDESENRLEYFDYKCFRFLDIINPIERPTTENLYVVERHYPWPGKTEFKSSDKELNQVWDICAESVRLCSQEGFMDCPHREKGQYVGGDGLITGHSHMLLTGDHRLVEKAIRQYAASARINPGLKCITPGNFMNEIADYSLQLPLLLELYYRFTGDLELLKECVPVVEGMLAYFRQFERPDGLIADVDTMLNFIDHQSEFYDPYDVVRSLKHSDALDRGPHAGLNAFYYGSLTSYHRILGLTGAESTKDFIDPECIRVAFSNAFLNRETGLFTDREQSEHPSLYTNTLALYFGLLGNESKKPVITLIKSKGLACTPYFASFVLHALCRNDEIQTAFDLINSPSRHSWKNMIRNGATTAWEVWDVEMKRNISKCHSWSSVPISILIEYMMGIKPLKPGWKGILFEPRPDINLEYATLSLPIPNGQATVSFGRQSETEGSRVKYHLTVPLETEVVIPSKEEFKKTVCDYKNGEYSVDVE